MPRFKVQSGKTPFKNPWGGETSWIEVEAASLEECLMKTRLQQPGVPILNVFAMKPAISQGVKHGPMTTGELLLSTFEEIPE